MNMIHKGQIKNLERGYVLGRIKFIHSRGLSSNCTENNAKAVLPMEYSY